MLVFRYNYMHAYKNDSLTCTCLNINTHTLHYTRALYDTFSWILSADYIWMLCDIHILIHAHIQEWRLHLHTHTHVQTHKKYTYKHIHINTLHSYTHYTYAHKNIHAYVYTTHTLIQTCMRIYTVGDDMPRAPGEDLSLLQPRGSKNRRRYVHLSTYTRKHTKKRPVTFGTTWFKNVKKTHTHTYIYTYIHKCIHKCMHAHCEKTGQCRRHVDPGIKRSACLLARAYMHTYMHRHTHTRRLLLCIQV